MPVIQMLSENGDLLLELSKGLAQDNVQQYCHQLRHGHRSLLFFPHRTLNVT